MSSMLRLREGQFGNWSKGKSREMRNAICLEQSVRTLIEDLGTLANGGWMDVSSVEGIGLRSTSKGYERAHTRSARLYRSRVGA